jgi:hypothetical protein
MSPSSPQAFASPIGIGLKAIGVFLLFGATMAAVAGITLVWRGTALDRMWALNPRAYNELAPLGKAVGLLFLSLAVALAIAGIGWLARRRWGWLLAVVIIGAQLLGNLVNIVVGRVVEGVVGILTAGALLFYMTRPHVRVNFAVKPQPIVHIDAP